LTAEESVDWLNDNMIPVFPLGEIKKAAVPLAKPVAARLEGAA
jgi:hypothetical protein